MKETKICTKGKQIGDNLFLGAKFKKTIKPQQNYKQLLINHYGFKECDFYTEEETIYLNSKDNVGETVRNVYEDLLMQFKESYEE